MRRKFWGFLALLAGLAATVVAEEPTIGGLTPPVSVASWTTMIGEVAAYIGAILAVVVSLVLVFIAIRAGLLMMRRYIRGA